MKNFLLFLLSFCSSIQSLDIRHKRIPPKKQLEFYAKRAPLEQFKLYCNLLPIELKKLLLEFIEYKMNFRDIDEVVKQMGTKWQGFKRYIVINKNFFNAVHIALHEVHKYETKLVKELVKKGIKVNNIFIHSKKVWNEYYNVLQESID